MVIGLTGSIASGKSTAARCLESLGAHLVDADRLGHLAYEPGTRAYRAILSAFGAELASEDDRIDRRALACLAFGDRRALERLTAIVWPEIRRLAQQRISALLACDPEGIVVLEAAVLLEAGWEDLVDEVWVILSDPDTALRRAMERDGSAETEVRRRIDAQMPNRERVERAHVVIENDGEVALLERRLEAEWRRARAGLGGRPGTRREDAGGRDTT